MEEDGILKQTQESPGLSRRRAAASGPARRRSWHESHDFLQVNIDLLTCSVWLVTTFTTATAETAAHNYVGSVIRDVGLPDASQWKPQKVLTWNIPGIYQVCTFAINRPGIYEVYSKYMISK
jgi:hypothetical protein